MIKTKLTALTSRVLASIALVIVTSADSCNPGLNTGGVATAFNLGIRSMVDSTKKHPPNVSFPVSASCLPGQQLVGGGYNLINKPNTPTLVAVEGSYPSAANTWTVQVRNPDNPSYYSGDADVAIAVLAYCVTTSNLDLATEIVTKTATIPQSATVPKISMFAVPRQAAWY